VFRHVPNILTGSRLVLATVFFSMLALYQYDGRGDPTFLNIGFVVYLVALATDYFDGYLARKWKVEGMFGRIVDPFVDKILVLGSFIFFAGKNFIIPDTAQHGASPMVVKTITGVAPGMVVILLARELLITTLRGVSESSGRSFGAVMAGKFKMVIQSITILAILVYVNYRPWLLRMEYEAPARVFRDFLIWTTVVVTVVSGFQYLRRAAALYTEGAIKE
jgi:CDP-diacylglycerol--glycerol-3-phosphate 3-phosphatidyltransferase